LHAVSQASTSNERQLSGIGRPVSIAYPAVGQPELFDPPLRDRGPDLRPRIVATIGVTLSVVEDRVI
jgi:hypothetical protein